MMDLQAIQQGVGGLVLENWDLRLELQKLQRSLVSQLSKDNPPQGGSPLLEALELSPDQLTPPDPKSIG